MLLARSWFSPASVIGYGCRARAKLINGPNIFTQESARYVQAWFNESTDKKLTTLELKAGVDLDRSVGCKSWNRRKWPRWLVPN